MLRGIAVVSQISAISHFRERLDSKQHFSDTQLERDLLSCRPLRASIE